MNGDPRDYKLDIAGLSQSQPAKPAARPFLSVLFKCCGVYQRVYQAADKQSYAGRCPKCLRPITFRVGEGGTNERHFVVE
jgi:hypothetical protein